MNANEGTSASLNSLWDSDNTGLQIQGLANKRQNFINELLDIDPNDPKLDDISSGEMELALAELAKMQTGDFGLNFEGLTEEVFPLDETERLQNLISWHEECLKIEERAKRDSRDVLTKIIDQMIRVSHTLLKEPKTEKERLHYISQRSQIINDLMVPKRRGRNVTVKLQVRIQDPFGIKKRDGVHLSRGGRVCYAEEEE